MKNIIVVTGAITSASRLSKKLERMGCINCQVIHTPSAISSGGCSYSVKMTENYLDTVLSVKDKPGIKIKNIYEEINTEKGSEYNDIFR